MRVDAPIDHRVAGAAHRGHRRIADRSALGAGAWRGCSDFLQHHEVLRARLLREHRLGVLVTSHPSGKLQREAQQRMQEHVAAHDAVFGFVAEHEAVDALEILIAIERLSPRRRRTFPPPARPRPRARPDRDASTASSARRAR